MNALPTHCYRLTDSTIVCRCETTTNLLASTPQQPQSSIPTTMLRINRDACYWYGWVYKYQLNRISKQSKLQRGVLSTFGSRSRSATLSSHWTTVAMRFWLRQTLAMYHTWAILHIDSGIDHHEQPPCPCQCQSHKTSDYLYRCIYLIIFLLCYAGLLKEWKRAYNTASYPCRYMSVVWCNDVCNRQTRGHCTQLFAHSLRRAAIQCVAASKKNVLKQHASVLLTTFGDGIVGCMVQWQCVWTEWRVRWMEQRFAACQ
jgi:hypothetical protein